jgi:hypothetical protein
MIQGYIKSFYKKRIISQLLRHFYRRIIIPFNGLDN